MLEIQLIGNLGRDAEVKEIGGKNVTVFSVACHEQWKDKQGEKQERTTWLNCIYPPEKIAQYLKKGQSVFLRGKPYAKAWTKEDGTVESSLNLRVNELLFNGKNSDSAPKQSAPDSKEEMPF